jgi:hypothetical protein
MILFLTKVLTVSNSSRIPLALLPEIIEFSMTLSEFDTSNQIPVPLLSAEICPLMMLWFV